MHLIEEQTFEYIDGLPVGELSIVVVELPCDPLVKKKA